MAKKQMQAGGDAFMKKYEEWQKNGANKIEEVKTEPKKVEKTEKKPSKVEEELKIAKATEAADKKKKEELKKVTEAADKKKKEIEEV